MRGMRAIGGEGEAGVVEADITPEDGEVVMTDEVVLISLLKEYLKASPWQSHFDGGKMEMNRDGKSLNLTHLRKHKFHEVLNIRIDLRSSTNAERAYPYETD